MNVQGYFVVRSGKNLFSLLHTKHHTDILRTKPQVSSRVNFIVGSERLYTLKYR